MCWRLAPLDPPPPSHGMVPPRAAREALGLQRERSWRSGGPWDCSGSAPGLPEGAGTAVGALLHFWRALGLQSERF